MFIFTQSLSEHLSQGHAFDPPTPRDHTLRDVRTFTPSYDYATTAFVSSLGTWAVSIGLRRAAGRRLPSTSTLTVPFG